MRSSACGSTLISLFSTVNSKVMVMLSFPNSSDISMLGLGKVAAVDCGKKSKIEGLSGSLVY